VIEALLLEPSEMLSSLLGLKTMRLPSLDRLRERWHGLARACGNPFLSWEWSSTWWKHFGEEREQVILGCEDGDGELVGIAPLYVDSERPMRVVRPIGHFPADVLGVIAAPEHAAAVDRAFAAHLAEEEEWDVLLLERTPDPGLADPLDARRIRTYIEPELRIEAEDWDGFLRSKSKNFRGQVRNYENRLRRDHEFELRLCDDPARLEADFETLVRLHQMTRELRGDHPLGAFPPELAAFHLDFARAALEQGWLRFWIASIDGEPAAAWYGFRYGGADWFYQSGRDPRWLRESVGFVLMAHTVRDAVEHDIHTYKLLLGNEDYKARFATDNPAVDSFAATRGLRGRAALGAKLTSLRLRERLGRGEE
jgi:CelD/BcsL family acetyltransferase involved in cellulose biosynthesis